jgi:hypothetical protein
MVNFRDKLSLLETLKDQIIRLNLCYHWMTGSTILETAYMQMSLKGSKKDFIDKLDPHAKRHTHNIALCPLKALLKSKKLALITSIDHQISFSINVI